MYPPWWTSTGYSSVRRRRHRTATVAIAVHHLEEKAGHCVKNYNHHSQTLLLVSYYPTDRVDWKEKCFFHQMYSLIFEQRTSFTAVLSQNCSFDSVWSKIGTLQDYFVLCKSAATPLPTLRFLTTNKSFQMRSCMNFFFKGHQNCQKSNLKVH